MGQLDSADVSDWSEEGPGDPLEPGPEGQMIRDFIPPVVPDYCKIYHPVYADPGPTEAETWDQVEKRRSSRWES